MTDTDNARLILMRLNLCNHVVLLPCIKLFYTLLSIRSRPLRFVKMGGCSTKALVLQKLLLVWTIMVATLSCSSHSKCEFEAIFNFGDSNSDTGGFWAAFPAQSRPFGMTYFKKPTGRATDGRLIVDFLGNYILNICMHIVYFLGIKLYIHTLIEFVYLISNFITCLIISDT